MSAFAPRVSGAYCRALGRGSPSLCVVGVEAGGLAKEDSRLWGLFLRQKIRRELAGTYSKRCATLYV